jgi:ubiquitin-conjugating enzyme E2 variant
VSGAPARRPAWVGALDTCSLALAAGLTGLALARVGALPPLAWLPLLALSTLAGWAFADFASGLVHFLCDRLGSEATPLLGPAVIRPFREHHDDPCAIANHRFVELSGNSALALTPMLALGGELAPLFGDALLPSAAFSGLMSACLGLFATNQIHRWAHMPRTPRIARVLRSLGLAIREEAHARHHRGAHDVAFCITNGWCNAPLDRVQFWARLERAMRARSGTRSPSEHDYRGVRAPTAEQDA